MRKPKVMVIDDEPDIRSLLETLLNSEGFEVISAANGKEALELLMEQPGEIVCILLDIMMPEMDGWEVLRIIKTTEETKNIPVIMLTVKDAHADKVHAIKEGANDYITKPFEVEEVVEKIRKHMKKEG